MADLSQKKGQITDRLQKREDDRLAGVQKRKDEKESVSVAHESANFFTDSFNKSQTDIGARLAASESLSKAKLTDHFDSLTVDVQKIQNFLNDSIMFLPSYEQQKSQETIQRLQAEIKEKRDKLIPKKKFAFKSKKKETVINGVDKPVSLPAETKKDLKVEITGCHFADVSSENLMKESDEINGKDMALARLTDCQVKLYGSPSAIHINNLKNCKVFSGPVSGSIFIDGCTDCVFVLPCQQLRIHSTVDTQFYIHVTSRAIVEDCTRVEFAPYNWQYPAIDKHYDISGLDKARNNWDDVDDFNWLASDSHSPNWNVLPIDKRVDHSD